MDNEVDNTAKIVYNEDNEIIRMAGREPLNDPKCEHEFREDPTDTIGDKVAWMCIKENCGVGHWKNKNPS